LNTEDEEVLRRLEEEANLPNEEREYLLKQNEELRGLLKEY